LGDIGGAGGWNASSASTLAAAGVETLQLAATVQFALAQARLFGDFGGFEMWGIILASLLSDRGENAMLAHMTSKNQIMEG